MDALTRYSWPGNVRELENVMERLVVLVRSGRVELRDLPATVRQGMTDIRLRSAPGTLQELERVRIVDALEQADGNKKLAARRLGIHRSTLYAKLRRYGLLDAEHAASDNGKGPNEQQGESDSTTPPRS
jgi:two-component system response regulator HydG